VFGVLAVLTLPGASFAQRVGRHSGGSPLYFGNPAYGGYSFPYYANTYLRGSVFNSGLPSVPFPAYRYSPDTSSTSNEVQNSNAAILELKVPENAEVWFEGDKTVQTGAVRYFVSPSLQPGRTFTYDIRARWTDLGGNPVDRTKQVKVQAGARVEVDFNNP
jgi:uncharacterized protein (TIGR03000 family)